MPPFEGPQSSETSAESEPPKELIPDEDDPSPFDNYGGNTEPATKEEIESSRKNWDQVSQEDIDGLFDE